MAPNTNIMPYLSFLMTKIHGRLIKFYGLPMTKSSYLFPDSFCTFVMHLTGISVLWGQKMPLKTHIGLHLFFPATKSPGRWVLFDVLPITKPCALIFSSVWTVIADLHAFLPFAWRNMPPPQITIGPYLPFLASLTPWR